MIKVELQNKFVYVRIDDNDWMLIRDEKGEEKNITHNKRVSDCRSHLLATFWEDTKISDISDACKRYSILPK